MIDHILGKPSPLWRRAQVFLVIAFWAWRLCNGDGRRGRRRDGQGRRIYRRGWFGIVGWVNRRLGIFSPYQLIVATLTLMYTLRNLDVILGLQAPEPLARLYSRSYYRATYIATAFDAGFATAMNLRPVWLRDLCSILFTGYYLVWATEADEKLRRFRALPTVEMLRVTWEKTNNPYLRFMTYFDRPRLSCVRRILLPRPQDAKVATPIPAMLFFSRPETELAKCTEVIFDCAGGGFVAMGPECHEERLRRWAKRTGKPVISIDYGKAPEYPYPYSIEQCFDAYRTLVESKGRAIGIRSGKIDMILSGDSAGGNIIATIMFNILESPTPIQRPVALVFAYPALDFNFTSWMTPEHLRVLRTEQSSNNIPGFEEGKDHMRHKSPLSVVRDVEPLPEGTERQQARKRTASGRWGWLPGPSRGNLAAGEGATSTADTRREAEKSITERIKTPLVEKSMESLQTALSAAADKEAAARAGQVSMAQLGTRLTMTSRTGYFQDRIISPSMMRAMAILYIGPKLNPDFQTDYYISPILAPARLLAEFPPVYMICGEKDPFVDDTVIFAGKIREAKRARKADAKRAQVQRISRVREGLRMSQARKAEAEDPILDEQEEDWVQMRIIEGWGHGFMQMLSLIGSVESVLYDMADWIDEAFAQAASKRQEQESKVPQLTRTFSGPFNLVKPAAYKPTRENKRLGSADLGLPVAESDDGDEDSGDDVLSFSAKNRKSSSGGSTSNRLTPPRLDLPRNSSAPRFNLSDELLTPTDQDLQSSVRQVFEAAAPLPYRSGKSTFAMFGSSKAEGPRLAPPKDKEKGKDRAGSPGSNDSRKHGSKAGSGLTEAELMRRRREDAVYGMAAESVQDEISAEYSEPQDSGFRW